MSVPNFLFSLDDPVDDVAETVTQEELVTT